MGMGETETLSPSKYEAGLPTTGPRHLVRQKKNSPYTQLCSRICIKLVTELCETLVKLATGLCETLVKLVTGLCKTLVKLATGL